MTSSLSLDPVELRRSRYMEPAVNSHLVFQRLRRTFIGLHFVFLAFGFILGVGSSDPSFRVRSNTENIVPHTPIPAHPLVPTVEETETPTELGLATDEDPEQASADPNDQVDDLLLDQADVPEVDLQLDEPIVAVGDVPEANLAMMQPVGPAGALMPAFGQVQNGGIVESPLIRSLLGIL
ncbi:hypothetical protein RhiLY_06586 [Ceratobasidium sp. AG-Ba]|nr:hypothetical protein RhiLY_06586 [Ceratobasidium sp. AG-Ba]